MLTISNIILTSNTTLLPTIPTFLTSNIPNFQMNSYFEGQCKNDLSDLKYLSQEYPICSLSGRIKVDPELGSSSLRAFIRKNDVEMSEKEDEINEFVTNVIKGNFTRKMLSDDELPYKAMAGFARGCLTVWEISDVLLWHQRNKDYRDNKLHVLPLLDEHKHWTPEAHTVLNQKVAYGFGCINKFNSQDEEKLLHLIRNSPRSQQVFLKFEKPVTLISIDKIIELSSLAFGAFLEVETGRQFKVQPRIGVFTKKEIIDEFIDERSRSINTYWPGLISNPRFNKNVASLSKISGHDWAHRLMMHVYSTDLLNVLREILASFKSLTKETYSKETWQLTDFAHSTFKTRILESFNLIKKLSMI